MPTSPNSHPITECYRCSTPLPEGTRICPECGRKQYRTCYCGTEIPVTAPRCANCGADWSNSYRIRRKAKPRRPNYKSVAKSAALGSAIALVAAGLLNAIVTGLASRSLAGDQQIPTSVTQKVWLAINTVGTILQTIGHRLAERSGGLATAIVVIIVGAGIGALTYLARRGFLRLGKNRKHDSRRRRSDSSGSSGLK